MEVNLAIFIMAVGLLAMVALYPLAYRESRQSQDDVKAAAAADCVLNTLVATLSSRNIKWNDWVSGITRAQGLTGDKPREGGWLAYCDWENDSFFPKTRNQINTLAKSVFNELKGIDKDNGGRLSWPLNNELACGIVVQWGLLPVYKQGMKQYMRDYSRVSIGIRATRRAGDLLAQPIFYTEVHFQGDQKDLEE